MLASDQGGMMSHLHDKAAQAAAATQVLHVLQQQDTEAAVKSAELAARSITAEVKHAEAVRAEAHAAGRLLEVQASAQAQAGGRGGSTTISGSRGRADVATRQQLETVRRQMEEAVAARSEAQAELQGLRAALTREQKQVGAGGRLCSAGVLLRIAVYNLGGGRVPNQCVLPCGACWCKPFFA